MRTRNSTLQNIANQLSKLPDLPLLFIRMVLAYGFFGTAKMKWMDINAIAEWFESINIPLPTLNAYLAAGTESAGVILLFLGLGTRLITLPLMIVMVVAIFAVHWGNGFEAGKNGIEIPLYYLVMLFTLFIIGPGKISIDQLLKGKKKSPYMY